MSTDVKLRIDQLISEFSSLSDPFLRYTYLIELGGLLPPMDSVWRQDENLFPGCQSKVWIHTELRQGRLFFQADSDAVVMRGILYLLHAAYNGALINEARQAPLNILEKTGLAEEFSAQRGMAVQTLVRRILYENEEASIFSPVQASHNR